MTIFGSKLYFFENVHSQNYFIFYLFSHETFPYIENPSCQPDLNVPRPQKLISEQSNCRISHTNDGELSYKALSAYMTVSLSKKAPLKQDWG